MTTPPRMMHGTICAIEFHTSSTVPTRRFHCAVITERNTLVMCEARFEDTDFIGFYPLHDDLRQPLRGTAVLGWCEMPPVSLVLQKLYPSPPPPTGQVVQLPEREPLLHSA